MPRSSPRIPTLVFLVSALTVPLAPAGAAAGLLEENYLVPADNDTWIEESNPGQTRGSDKELRVRNEFGNRLRTLYRFPMPSIGGESVGRATLRLRITKEDDNARKVYLYRMTVPWTESSANWSSIGSHFDSTAIIAEFVPATDGAVSVDLTYLVQQWANGTPNYGFILASDPDDDESRYTSREWTPAGEQPSLAITTLGLTLNLLDVGLAKSVSNPAPSEGDTIQFTVTATNSNVLEAATSVRIMDVLPAGLTYVGHTTTRGAYTPSSGTWLIGRIEPGGSAGLTISAKVDTGTVGTTITNTAALAGLHQSDTNGANNVASAAIVVVASDLLLRKTASDSLPAELEPLEYHLVVRNAGPSSATGIVASDVLPPQVTYVSSTPSRGTYTPGNGLWTIGGIAVGDSVSLVIRTTVNAGTAGSTFTNVASVVAADQFDPVPGNEADSATVTVATADLAITKTVSDATPPVGATLRYTLVVTNSGPNVASLIAVTDSIPSGITYSHHAATQGVYDPGTSLWEIGTLAAADSVTLQLFGSVDSGTQGSTITNTATITRSDATDPNVANDTDSVDIVVDLLAPIQVADIQVNKLVDDATPYEGDTIHFGIAVQSLGPDNGTDIVIRDLLPPGLTFVGATPSMGIYSPASGDWTLGTLTVGAIAVMDLVASVDSATAGETLTNTAFVSAATSIDLTPGNNSDDASVVPTLIPGVELRTVGGPTLVTEGQTGVAWTVDVANVGFDPVNVDSVNFQFTRSVPGDLDGAFVVTPSAGNPNPIPGESTATLAFEVDLLAGATPGPLTIGASVVATDTGPGGTLTDDEPDSLLAVTIQSAANLSAVPGTLAPSTVPQGLADVYFFVDVTNSGDVTLSLEAGSELHVFAPGDTLEVPFDSGSVSRVGAGTLSFGPVTIPPAFPDGTHPVELDLVGVDENGADYAQVVTVSDSLVVSPVGILLTAAQTGATVRPGDAPVSLYRLSFASSADTLVSLDQLRLHNATTGPGTADELDGEFGTLELYLDDGDGTWNAALDSALGSGSLIGGTVTFSPALPIADGAAGMLHVVGGPSLLARDGDSLDVAIASAADVTFDQPVTLFNAFPLAPVARFLVNGMTLAQVPRRALPDSSAFRGDVDVLALDFVLPGNGYEADTLNEIRFVNQGSALAGIDIQRIRLWADGGDDVFDAGAGDDVSLGEATWNVTQWSIAGLSAPLTAGGRRFFAAVDITPTAVLTRTIRLAMPQNGVVVASNNDGPIAGAAPSPTILTIREPISQLEIAIDPQTGETFLPGVNGRVVFSMEIANTAASAETLTSVTFTNTAVGLGNQEQLDANWRRLRLQATTRFDDVLEDLGRVDVSFSGGRATFDGLSVRIAPSDTAQIVLTSGAALTARDGDVLDLEIGSESDLLFERTVEYVGASFPLAPAGSFPIDGMSAAQISLVGTVPPTVLTGSTNNLAFGFRVPPNGYQTDVLRFLNVVTDTTGDAALPVDDIARVKAWLDDGDAVFEPADDTLLGEMFHTGSVWQRSGLSLPIPLAGEVLFVTCDIAPDADLGSRILFGLPSLPGPAFSVDTANDGPIDAARWNTASQTITASDRISFTAQFVDAVAVAPGTAAAPLLQLSVTNLYDVPKTLSGIRITNRTVGSGTQTQLDNETLQLHLRANSNDTASTIATDAFSSGVAAFDALSLTIEPGVSVPLFVVADVAWLPAKDGDVLGAEIADVTDITFADLEAVVVDNFPLQSNAAHPIDGMVAGQIVDFGAPGATIGPGEGPVLAFDLAIPSNGYSADVLEGVRIVNTSSADSAAIDEMRLWADGGDGVFDAGAVDDVALGGPLSFLGGEWVSAALSHSIPVGGTRVFVSVASSPTIADSSRVRLAVPAMGITVSSSNDGPWDEAVTNVEDILFSNAALLATLEVAPAHANVGQTVSLQMTVKNNGIAVIDSIVVANLDSFGTGTATLMSAPSPAFLSLAPEEEGTFSWIVSADSVGVVRFTGNVEGVEQGSGFLRQSLDGTSNEHQIFYATDSVSLTPVESMPFSINRGQTNVVPLSLTFENEGPLESAAVEVLRIGVRLVDELGAGIPPADLLSRIMVKEGTNTYVDHMVTETDASGALDLLLTPIPRVTAQDEKTLSLSIDVSDSTTVPNFRLMITDASSFAARDAVDFSAVSIELEAPAVYPIQSGLARVVGEATQLVVAAPLASNPPLTVGPGQDAVPLLNLDLYNPDVDSLAADVRVNSFALTVLDSSGVPLTQPSSLLERIRVRAGGQTLANRPVGPADGSSFSVLLSPLLSVPVETPTSILVEADLATQAAIGRFRLALADSSQFDARDANTGAPVPVIYAADPLSGSAFTVEAAADSMLARCVPELPSSTPVGQIDVAAMTVVMRHPGDSETAPIRCDSLRVQCRGAANQPLAPGTFVDRVRVMRGGVEVGGTTNLPLSGGEFTIPLNGVALPPGSSDSLGIRFDVEATAPAALFQMSITAAGVFAVDANLGVPVEVAADSGAAFPLSSGLTQFESPARELAAAFESAMPAVLVADGSEVTVATVSLRNTAAASANDIAVDRLQLRAADNEYFEVPLGAFAERAQAYVGDTLWAESASLDPTAVTAWLVAPDTLRIAPGAPIDVEVRLILRGATEITSARVGCAAPDVGVVQPESALLSVSVTAESGQTFPFWTATGNFSPRSLAESYANFPNPFAAGRDETTFVFYLPQEGRVSLKVFTVRGESVVTLLDQTTFAPGLRQTEIWDGRNGRGQVVVNGVYLAELTVSFADGTSERLLRKVAVVR